MDCVRCGGSNRQQYCACPRCGLYDPTEQAQMLTAVQAGGGSAAEQAAITTDQNLTPDSPGQPG